jgi:hypothetical protein
LQNVEHEVKEEERSKLKPDRRELDGRPEVVSENATEDEDGLMCVLKNGASRSSVWKCSCAKIDKGQ